MLAFRRNRSVPRAFGLVVLFIGSACSATGSNDPGDAASSPRGASVPSTGPESVPSAAPGPVLRIDFAGWDAILADPRDAGLRRALSMLDDRLLELPAELGGPPIPPGVVELVLDVMSSPFSLSMDVADGGDSAQASPVRAQLTVRRASVEEADALALRFGALLSLLAPVPAVPVEGQPSLKSLAMPNGRLVYGKPSDGASFLVSWGEPAPSEPTLGSLGLPRGVEPVLALEFDAARLREPLESMFEEATEDEAARVVFECLGLLGEDPLGITFAFGHGSDRAHIAMRCRNWVKMAARLGSLATEPLSKADLHLVPADATQASVERVDLRAILSFLEMLDREEEGDLLAKIESTLGLDLEADVFAPLGKTVGFYMSDTTGGGGLASLVAFLAVEDGAKVAQTLDKAIVAIHELAKGEASGHVRVRPWDHSGAACHSLTFPGLPIPIEPSLGISDGFLFLAATPQALVAAIDQARGNAPGLLAHPGFRHPPAGSFDDLQAVSFSDTPRLLNDGYGLAGLLASALANGVRSPSDPAREPGLVLPPYDELLAGARPSILLSRIQGDDLVIVGECDRSAMANLTAWLGGPASLILGAGLAATAVIPNVVAQVSATNQMRATSDIVAITEAINEYAVVHGGRYPDSLEELVTPDENGRTYLDRDEVPLDPWGNPYLYRCPDEQRHKPLVFTLGADGVPGGAGEDRDIDSLELAEGASRH